MSTFADLFRHFPDKVMDLCLDECFMERRPVYYFDSGQDVIPPKCWVCGQRSIFRWSDDRYDSVHYLPPLPDLTQETCGDERCLSSYEFFTARGRIGSRRRAKYKERYGQTVWQAMGTEEQAASIAAVMLELMIAEGANGDATNGRRAA